MNSIEQYDNGSSIVEEIRLMLNHNISEDRLLILCEDMSDCKCYKEAFISGKVLFHQTKGCGDYQDILCDLCEFGNRFIILKDADFDNLDCKHYRYDNIFLTDTHDIETMLLLNERIKAKIADVVIANELYGVKKIDELLNKAINYISNISYVKWLNYHNRYDLDVQSTQLR